MQTRYFPSGSILRQTRSGSLYYFLEKEPVNFVLSNLSLNFLNNYNSSIRENDLLNNEEELYELQKKIDSLKVKNGLVQRSKCIKLKKISVLSKRCEKNHMNDLFRFAFLLYHLSTLFGLCVLLE